MDYPEFQYCTFLNKILEYDDLGREISSDTHRKVAAAQEYFRQYYLDLFSYLQARKERRDEVMEEVSFLSGSASAEALKAHDAEESQYLRTRRTKMSVEEFTNLALLGRGGFGDVYLCRKNDTGEIVALKTMDKSRFTSTNQIQRVMKEREILSGIVSPWLVQLKYSFSSATQLFMAMEYIPGGDMRSLLENIGSLSEMEAKFYAAELFLALDHLHSAGYIHRDLKPSNVMITSTGHLKLIDFGLSKDEMIPASDCSPSQSEKIPRVDPRNKRRPSALTWQRNSLDSLDTEGMPDFFSPNKRHMSLVGSPEYMAVEMVLGEEYSHLVDYWSAGVILYELVSGTAPFAGETPQKVFDKISAWPGQLSWDSLEVSEECKDFLRSLICHHSSRLGQLRGFKEIETHPWFEGFDWDGVLGMTAPFVPKLDDDIDTSYFDAVSSDSPSSRVSSPPTSLSSTPDSPASPILAFEKPEPASLIRYDSSSSEFDFAGFSYRNAETIVSPPPSGASSPRHAWSSSNLASSNNSSDSSAGTSPSAKKSRRLTSPRMSSPSEPPSPQMRIRMHSRSMTRVPIMRHQDTVGLATAESPSDASPLRSLRSSLTLMMSLHTLLEDVPSTQPIVATPEKESDAGTNDPNPTNFQFKANLFRTAECSSENH